MMTKLVSQEDGPVLVIRDEGPGKHCSNRDFEWYAALAMVSIAVCIFITPRTIELGAFRYLVTMGFSSTWLWILYTIIGSTRIITLTLNGSIPFCGPHIRAVCCVVSAILWSMMAIALVRVTEDTGTLSIGIGAWGWAVFFEMRALNRALRDVGIG